MLFQSFHLLGARAELCCIFSFSVYWNLRTLLDAASVGFINLKAASCVYVVKKMLSKNEKKVLTHRATRKAYVSFHAYVTSFL